MGIAHRPNVFDQAYFEQRLLDLGCPDTFVKPITSDYRLFVPLIFKLLGEERLFDLVDGYRSELKLGMQEPAWRVACKYIVTWADDEIEKYKSQK
jgi:hypothetical protein